MQKSKGMFRMILPMVASIAAAAMCASVLVAFASEDLEESQLQVSSTDGTVTTYLTTANISLDGEQNTTGKTLYLTNPNMTEDSGSYSLPTTPTEEQTAVLVDNGDGTYQLTVCLEDCTVVASEIGTEASDDDGNTSASVLCYRKADFSSGSPDMTEYIVEVTFVLESEQDSYVFDGCCVFNYRGYQTYEDVELELVVDFEGATEATVETESHSYATSTWDWSTDLLSAVTVLTCTDDDCDDVLYVPATVSTQSTENEGGSTIYTYTASAEYDGQTYSDSCSVEVASDTVVWWAIGSDRAPDVIAYLLEDGTLLFEGTGDTPDYDYSYTFHNEAPWYADYANRISSVEFGEGVTPDDLSYYFYECSNLTDVSALPDSVTTLSYTFAYCTSLASLPEGFVLPDSTTDCSLMFLECTSLASLPDGFTITGSVTTCSSMFSGCSSLASLPEDFNIGDSVTSCSGMFSDCSSLASLPEGFVLPDSVTKVNSMFYGCESLVSLPDGFVLPDSVTQCYYMFFGCTSLVSLPDGFTIPSNVWICEYMFYGCTSLVSLPEGFTIKASGPIASYMFYGCSSLTAIPDGFVKGTDETVDEESRYMFAYCTSLTSLPDDMHLHGDCYGMFYGCSALTELPSGLFAESYSGNFGYMFAYCTSLETLPDGFTLAGFNVVHYGTGMFYDCTSLTELPEGFEIQGFQESDTDNDSMAFGLSSSSGYSSDNLLETRVHASDYESLLDSYNWTKSYRTLVCIHDYECVWTWDGLDAATVTMTCSGCGDVQTLTATVESSITNEATCTEDGTLTYTASVVDDDTTYSDSIDFVISATGHTEGEAVTENEVAATCTTDGSYDTVVYCSVCGEELSRETTVVSATGHTYDYSNLTWTWTEGYGSATVSYACTVCGTVETAYAEVAVETVAATCTEAGSVTYTATATVDGQAVSDAVSVTVPATGHTAGSYVVENEVAATCETAGSYDVVVRCTDCGEVLFSYTVAVAATGHTAAEAVVENEADATCTTNGSYDSVVYCTVCRAELSRYTMVVPATGHTAGSYVVENEVAATCEAAGSYDVVVRCTDCGEVLFSYTVAVAATGHDYVATETVDANCTEDGYTVYECANDPSHTYTETIEATGHVEGEVVVENEVAATCAGDGSYDAVVYCAVCGEELSRETVAIAATGHVEGEAVVENEVAATCTADGSYDTVVYCTVCGEELSRETVAVAATGHDWTAGWAWSDDLSSATLTLTCANDASHTATVEATVTSVSDGLSTAYTATASYDGVEYVATATGAQVTIARIAGSDRYETAALEALEAYGETGADTVVLATGTGYADALAATSLAGALDAPVLLTKTAELSDAAAYAIEQLGAAGVIVVGGEGAVSADVAAALEDMGLEVTRLAGSDRYGTAEAIYAYGLENGLWGGTVIVASGTGYADALSVSPLAYAESWPVLLAGRDGSLTEESEAAIASAQADGSLAAAVVVGGTGVVSADAESFLSGLFGAGSVTRLGGSDRYATSAIVAAWSVENGYLAWDGLAVASGANFPDALAGSALQGSSGSVLLLASDSNASALEAIDPAYVVDARILGGTGAVSNGVRDALAEALGWSEGYVYRLVEYPEADD